MLDIAYERNHIETIKEPKDEVLADMASITVKNIPDHAYEILKQVASSRHRSINSEIICLIEKATLSKPFHPEHHLAMAKRAREKTKKFLLTEDISQSAKEEGRP